MCVNWRYIDEQRTKFFPLSTSTEITTELIISRQVTTQRLVKEQTAFDLLEYDLI